MGFFDKDKGKDALVVGGTLISLISSGFNATPDSTQASRNLDADGGAASYSQSRSEEQTSRDINQGTVSNNDTSTSQSN